MKWIGGGILILAIYIAVNLGNDPLGWQARERAARLQLQQAEITTNAQLEAQRLDQDAAMQRVQVRAQLLEKYVRVLPQTVAIICVAVLLGLGMHLWWKRQMVQAANPRRRHAQRFNNVPPPTSPLVSISQADLHSLRRQAQALGHRLEVRRQGKRHQALLVENDTGRIQAQRVFVLTGEE